MAYEHIVRPTETVTGLAIDVRGITKEGKDLAQVISDSVHHTQTFLQTEIPGKLIVTQKQFASLNGYTSEMYHTTDRMYYTGKYVMEVKIDRKVDTIAEIDDILQDVEDYEAERKKEQEADDGTTQERKH